jgi:hypothetical protein
MTKSMRASRDGLLAIAGLTLLAVAHAEPQAVSVSPSFPGPEEYSNHNYDRRDELKLTGRIEHVDVLNAETIVWVRALSVMKQGSGVPPGTEAPGKGMVWRVVGPGLGKIKDKDRPKLAAGSDIVIFGDNGVDKSCTPTCRISSSRVTLK